MPWVCSCGQRNKVDGLPCLACDRLPTPEMEHFDHIEDAPPTPSGRRFREDPALLHEADASTESELEPESVEQPSPGRRFRFTIPDIEEEVAAVAAVETAPAAEPVVPPVVAAAPASPAPDVPVVESRVPASSGPQWPEFDRRIASRRAEDRRGDRRSDDAPVMESPVVDEPIAETPVTETPVSEVLPDRVDEELAPASASSVEPEPDSDSGELSADSFDQGLDEDDTREDEDAPEETDDSQLSSPWFAAASHTANLWASEATSDTATPAWPMHDDESWAAFGDTGAEAADVQDSNDVNGWSDVNAYVPDAPVEPESPSNGAWGGDVSAETASTIDDPWEAFRAAQEEAKREDPVLEPPVFAQELPPEIELPEVELEPVDVPALETEPDPFGALRHDDDERDDDEEHPETSDSDRQNSAGSSEPFAAAFPTPWADESFSVGAESTNEETVSPDHDWSAWTAASAENESSERSDDPWAAPSVGWSEADQWNETSATADVSEPPYVAETWAGADAAWPEAGQSLNDWSVQSENTAGIEQNEVEGSWPVAGQEVEHDWVTGAADQWTTVPAEWSSNATDWPADAQEPGAQAESTSVEASQQPSTEWYGQGQEWPADAQAWEQPTEPWAEQTAQESWDQPEQPWSEQPAQSWPDGEQPDWGQDYTWPAETNNGWDAQQPQQDTGWVESSTYEAAEPQGETWAEAEWNEPAVAESASSSTDDTDEDQWWQNDTSTGGQYAGYPTAAAGASGWDDYGTNSVSNLFDEGADLDEPDEFELDDDEWALPDEVPSASSNRTQMREPAKGKHWNKSKSGGRGDARRRPAPTKRKSSGGGGGFPFGDRSNIGTIIVVVVAIIVLSFMFKTAFGRLAAAPDPNAPVAAASCSEETASSAGAQIDLQATFVTPANSAVKVDQVAGTGTVDFSRALAAEPDPGSALAILDQSRFERGYDRSFDRNGGGIIHVAIYEFTGVACAAKYVQLHADAQATGTFDVSGLAGATGQSFAVGPKNVKDHVVRAPFGEWVVMATWKGDSNDAKATAGVISVASQQVAALAAAKSAAS